MARIKTVFSSNSQVAHVWAAQGQSHGRAGSMFFENDTIYSYGRHYAIARIYTKGTGHDYQKLALVNSKGYSITTAKHTNEVYNALRGRMSSIAVPNPSDINSDENEQYFLNNIANAMANLFDSRVFRGSYDTVKDEIKEYNTFKKFRDGKKFKEFQLDQVTCDILIELSIEKTLKDNARAAKRSERRELEHKKYEAERIARAAEYKSELELWPFGLNSKDIPYQFLPNEFDLVRIKSDGNTVETTRGAEVPMSHALNFLQAAKSKTLKVGQRIGHFTLDSIDGDILTIGCHKISISQASQALEHATMTSAVLEDKLENEFCFRDYTIAPRSLFGKVNKIAVHQCVDSDSLERDISNAIENFQRDGFGHIVFYV